ncbi:MAG: hypothetical protein LBG97_08030 [Coriobacteriales bacterium]|nr:hypothetical protein [Coriobacteriales bacterium]
MIMIRGTNMQYVLLMFLPLCIAAVGGGFITDEEQGKRNAGFALVAIATVAVIGLIAWSMIDPTYYIVGV